MYNRGMKKAVTTILSVLLAATATFAGGCDYRWDKALCDHDYETVVIEPNCKGDGYTADVCKKCDEQTNKRNVTYSNGKHRGVGVCPDCQATFVSLMIEDLKQAGQMTGDGWTWSQGIKQGETVSIFAQENGTTVKWEYICEDETIALEVNALAKEYDYVYTAGGAQSFGKLTPLTMTATGSASASAAALAEKLTKAVGQYFITAEKKYTLASFGFAT